MDSGLWKSLNGIYLKEKDKGGRGGGGGREGDNGRRRGRKVEEFNIDQVMNLRV